MYKNVRVRSKLYRKMNKLELMSYGQVNDSRILKICSRKTPLKFIEKFKSLRYILIIYIVLGW